MLSLFNSIIFSFGLLLAGFALMHWADVKVGSFGDWIFAMVSLFWILAIVTVPWNIYFKAKAVLADAGPSKERGLPVDARQVAYVHRLARLSLYVALGLHLASAIVLFILAYSGVSKFGYIAAVLALLLTALRPSASAYQYLAERLHTIGQNWKYPMQDVVELRGRVDSLESRANETAQQFDTSRPDSLITVQREHIDQTRSSLAKLEAELEALDARNQTQHEELSQQTRSAISQLSTDGQFLDHVREIIRFFKTA